MPSENIIVLTVDMFSRFSKIFHHNNYKQKIREIILKYIEKIFQNIPEIIFIVSKNILEKITNYQEIENRELVFFFNFHNNLSQNKVKYFNFFIKKFCKLRL